MLINSAAYLKQKQLHFIILYQAAYVISLVLSNLCHFYLLHFCRVCLKNFPDIDVFLNEDYFITLFKLCPLDRSLLIILQKFRG